LRCPWDYVRRAELALAARSIVLCREQHTPLFYGLKDNGRDFLYWYLLREADLFATAGAAPETMAPLYACAARLAPRVRDRGGFGMAGRLYTRAFAISVEPVDRARIAQEAGNIHANRRTDADLARATRWFRQAEQALAAVPESDPRASVLRVRLLNGLALVAYHRHDDSRALKLERDGIRFARRRRALPEMADWALPLLYANTAKLVEKRFRKRDFADRLLRGVARGTSGAAPRARIELGRLAAERGDHAAAIAWLAPLVDAEEPGMLLEDYEEAYATLLLAAAHGQLGRLDEQRRLVASCLARYPALGGMPLLPTGDNSSARPLPA
jgi:hypothetical protein